MGSFPSWDALRGGPPTDTVVCEASVYMVELGRLRLLLRWIAIGVALLWLSLSTSAAMAAESDADMAAEVLQIKHEMLTRARACETHYAEQGRTFRFAEYFWEGDYLEVLSGAALVAATVPTAKQVRMEQAFSEQDRLLGEIASTRSESDWNTACGDLYIRLVDKDRHMNAFDQPTQRRMSDVYVRSGAKPSVRRNNDLTIGCMKAQYNHGLRDFDTVKLVCGCLTDAMVSSASDEQLAVVAQNPASLVAQPWFAIARPKLNACKVLWGPHPH